jgi:CDP-diglyceride synthetase
MTVLSQLGVSAPLSYLAAFGLPALDAVMPVVPSETAVIALGVTTAGSTDPRIAILLILAAAGAFAGDNLGYLIGSRFGHLAERRLFAGKAFADRPWVGLLLALGATLVASGTSEGIRWILSQCRRRRVDSDVASLPTSTVACSGVYDHLKSRRVLERERS